MYTSLALATLTLLSTARAQGVGSLTAENKPKLNWKTCTGTGGNSCTSKNTPIVLDANWRWTHGNSGSTNCYTGSKWDSSYCPDNESCAKNCVVEGADYSGTYGITASNDALTLKYVTKGTYSTNIGSRTYLMENENKYQMFNLIGKEFTFDVDVSQLPCGLNGALYFVEMASDGGLGKGNNKAGAKYGTGYCDAQCPHDIKWINGAGNVKGWASNPNDPNAGSGELGTCCPEMDIWEANSVSNAYTPHPCKKNGLTACTGTDCGDGDNRYKGICDKDGCDYNPYRFGVKDFYGAGKKLDTKKKMTVVTQFIGSGSSLSEIKRFYVQNGQVFKNPESKLSGVSGSSITESFCKAQKSVFKDNTHFSDLGGLNQMASSLAKGHVLVMSLWSDVSVRMLWLDSTYPPEKAGQPGSERGECSTDSGAPDDLQKNSPNAQVTFSNIKFGPIGSTFAQPA